MGIRIRWDAAPGVQALGQYAQGQTQGQKRAADQYMQYQQLKLQQDTLGLREQQFDHQRQHLNQQLEMDRELHEMRRQQWQQENEAQMRAGLASGRLFFAPEQLHARQQLQGIIAQSPLDPNLSPQAAEDAVRQAQQRLAQIRPLERPIDERPRSMEEMFAEQVYWDPSGTPWTQGKDGDWQVPRGWSAPADPTPQIMTLARDLLKQTRTETRGEGDRQYDVDVPMFEPEEAIRKAQEMYRQIQGQEPAQPPPQTHFAQDQQPMGQPGYPEFAPPKRDGRREPEDPDREEKLRLAEEVRQLASRPMLPSREQPKQQSPAGRPAQQAETPPPKADEDEGWWASFARNWGPTIGKGGMGRPRVPREQPGWQPPGNASNGQSAEVAIPKGEYIHPVHNAVFAALQRAGIEKAEVIRDEHGNAFPVAKTEADAIAYRDALPGDQHVALIRPDGTYQFLRGRGPRLPSPR